MQTIPVVVICGPTASGKTDFAVSVFSSASKSGLQGCAQVINADSIQVYKDSVVCSARPDKEQLEALPHHLVAIYEGDKEFSLTDFVPEAESLAQEIFAKGKLPVIVGGTAFFLKHFLTELPETPPSNEITRSLLQKRLILEGEEALFHYLKSVDPVTACKVNIHDHYRVLRALEVYETSGKPLSSFTMPTQYRKGYDFLVCVVTRPREILYKRIERRVDILFEKGLVNEVTSLYNEGFTASSPIMKAIGYSEFFNSKGEFDTSDLEATKALIKRNTRRYAKRQETFFKALPNRLTFNLEESNEIDNLTKKIQSFYNRYFDSL